MFHKGSVSVAGQGREDTGKCKIAQKLPDCKIGLDTLKSIRDALCCPHRQSQHR